MVGETDCVMYLHWRPTIVNELAKVVKRRPYKEETVQGVEIETPVTRVSFIVPDNVIVRKEVPDVAWWDDTAKMWTTEGISDEQYDPERREITFGTRHLSTALALVQVHFCYFPNIYQKDMSLIAFLDDDWLIISQRHTMFHFIFGVLRR